MIDEDEGWLERKARELRTRESAGASWLKAPSGWWWWGGGLNPSQTAPTTRSLNLVPPQIQGGGVQSF